jgi:hypothetical protein
VAVREETIEGILGSRRRSAPAIAAAVGQQQHRRIGMTQRPLTESLRRQLSTINRVSTRPYNRIYVREQISLSLQHHLLRCRGPACSLLRTIIRLLKHSCHQPGRTLDRNNTLDQPHRSPHLADSRDQERSVATENALWHDAPC